MPSNTVQDRSLLAGISRLRAGLQFAIAWFQGLTALGIRGQIKNVVLGANLTGTVGPDDTLTIDATGGGGGGSVNSVTADGITAEVDNTDPANPIVSANGAVTISEAYADGLVTGLKGPGCTFGGTGTALSGSLTAEVTINYSGTITGWTIVANTAGDASISVSHAAYSAYDTMTSIFTATLSSAIKNQATGLSHAVSAGDVLRFAGSGFGTITRVNISLQMS